MMVDLIVSLHLAPLRASVPASSSGTAFVTHDALEMKCRQLKCLLRCEVLVVVLTASTKGGTIGLVGHKGKHLRILHDEPKFRMSTP
jgi:hypothetical protein